MFFHHTMTDGELISACRSATHQPVPMLRDRLAQHRATLDRVTRAAVSLPEPHGGAILEILEEPTK